MKRLTILAATLALGAAQAQTVPTAGSSIINQAEVTFNYVDPATSAETSGTSASNQVSTTVIGVPSYTITPNTGDAALSKSDVTVGEEVPFTYTVKNTGNTDLQITLSNANTANLSPSDVKITENSGTANDNIVTLAPGESTTVTQTYTIPAGATSGTVYGQNLIGTAESNTDGSTDGSYEDTSFTGAVDNNNENQATVVDFSGVGEGKPDTGLVEPVPTDPTNPNIGDGDNDGTPDTNDGYTNDDGVPVVVAPDGTQVAYPKADGDAAADTVTVPGSVTNGSTIPDDITIGPASDPDGAGPITTEIINPATGNPFQPGDTVVDSNGDPILGVTVTVNPDGSVTFEDVPAGASPAYEVKVTYPDTEGENAPTEDINVSVPIKSGNAGGAVVDTSSITVKTPNVDTVLGGVEGDNNIGTQTPSNTTTTTVDIEATVTNKGTYGEAYNITVADVDLPTGATVTIVGSNAQLVDTNSDGVPDQTVNLNPDETATYTVRVTLPANAPVGTDYTASTTATGDYSGTVDTDEASFDIGLVDDDTTTPTDPTDPGYTSNPLFPVSKTTSTTSVAPGGTINYTIAATNEYNLPVYNVVLRDPAGSSNVYTYADLTSATAGTLDAGGQLLYNDCSGAYAVTPNYTDINAADALCVAYDVNGDGSLTAADKLEPGKGFSVNLAFEVNE